MILFLGLGPLTELLPASDDLSLPPCCRRHGSHHCAMAAMMARMMAHMPPDPRPGFDVPLTCPNNPGPTAALSPPAPALAPAAIRLPAFRARVHTPSSGRAVALSSPIRIHAGRGPPASHFI
jgi:hypothetical protein